MPPEAAQPLESQIGVLLRDLHRLTVDTTLSPADRVTQLLMLGCTRTACTQGVFASFEPGPYTIECRVDLRPAGAAAPAQAVPASFPLPASASAVIDRPQVLTFAAAPTGAAPHPASPHAPLAACLSAPVWIDGRLAGVLEFLRPAPGDERFTEPQTQAAALLAEWLGAEQTRERRAGQARDAQQRLAICDELTSLANRATLMDRIGRAVARSQRVPGYCFAVLFLDFDRFKIINDSLGHRAGDELLRRIASRLSDNLRKVDSVSRLTDGHLAARIGGDEFVVLLDGIRTPADAGLVAERLQQALGLPYNIDGHEVITTASIGIVTSEGQYTSAETMLRDADTAMYKAKNAGRARHVVFDEKMHEEAVFRLNLEKDLRRALEREQFYLLYQPIVDLQDGFPLGFEALIRWRHPSLGAVSPDAFIPIAEETGLINEMGVWALYTGLRQIQAWQARFPSFDPPLSLNLNLSPRQLASPELVPTVRRVLDEVGVPPETIKLEITESMVMDHRQDLTPVLHALRDLGVKLAMDDFGTGHSSLACLHRFPIDVLKIDREFVWNMDEKREYAAVIQAIVTLAHTLGVKVVAEGIENADQLAQLQALDCDHAQGYHFARPLTIDEADRYLTGMLRSLRRSA